MKRLLTTFAVLGVLVGTAVAFAPVHAATTATHVQEGNGENGGN